MKTDYHGMSTCQPGQEQWEVFRVSSRRMLVQYDYRTPEGNLFSCVAPSVKEARAKRDEWLQKKAQVPA